MSACDPHEHCVTCGDVGTRMRVLRIDDDLAVCEADDGEPRTVEIALVEDVSEGDDLLVHGDVALVRL
jgi:hydrogenase maturation factor